MFVEVVQNNGNYYIRLVQSVRGTNSKGQSVSPEFATCLNKTPH